MSNYKCPLCQNPDPAKFLSLPNIPFVNTADDIRGYPLDVYHCSGCGLVFSNTPKKPEAIFSNYTYLSSFSDTWLGHCHELFRLLETDSMISPDSVITEIASNDGYMLRNFMENGYTDIMGIEPSVNAADKAREKGIPTTNDFFTNELARTIDRKSDCIIGLNVLAHVPDIRDFLKGVHSLLTEDGFAVFEFHYLLRLIKDRLFDTIYHEHFSYISLGTVFRLMPSLGLRLFDAQCIDSQGGSLRIFISKNNENAEKRYPTRKSVSELLEIEDEYKLNSLERMKEFADDTNKAISTNRDFLLNLSASGKTIAGYGASAKATVLINSIGINRSIISSIADMNPLKQNRLLPGTDIPVVKPSDMIAEQPDYVIIFPWNLRGEISQYLRSEMSGFSGFIVFNPEPEIFT